MIIALQLAFFTLAFSNSLETYHEYIRESNEIINYFVRSIVQPVDCGTDYWNACRQIDTVFEYPTVDIIAEQNASINVIGTIQPIGKIIISFTNFSIDFGDIFFQIDDDGSSLKFSSCNLFRNASKTAINSHSLVIVNRGSLILEKMNITGNILEGNEALIQSSQPLLIQFTSLNITRLSLIPENVEPLLLSVKEHDQNSQILVQDVHMKWNYAGNKAEAGIIYIHSKNLEINSMKNEINAANPILIENSEIIQNTLAPIQESCAIQLEGLRTSEIRITNSTFDNRSPPNNYRQYEFKIVLPSGMNPDDLKSKFRDIQLGVISFPVAVKVFPSTQYTDLLVPLGSDYTRFYVNSHGRESCTSYIANFHYDVQSIGCAVIIIRAQEKFGLTNKAERNIYIYGSFTENDLRTDGLNISFTGQSTSTTSNQISFKPNLPISANPLDNSLFRIRDGGQVTLTDLYIQRSNIAGSENAPIVIIKSGAVQQSNGLQKNAAGQIVINKCILEGGNSATSDAWYNLGLAETCNVGYYAAIVADGQTTVKISGSNIRSFEGPAIRTLNGARVSIDKNSILDNNGQRNRNTLSSMQTNVVCEGGIGTTTIDIALDNVTSFISTGNAWIFSPSGNKCTINATFNGEVALPRSLPYINSANVSINTTNQQAEVTINGKFLEPCIRTLLLELRESTKAGLGEVLSFDIESKSIQANWINSENIKFNFSSSLLEDLNTSVQWGVGIYEPGKRMTTKWALTYPVIDGIGQDEPGDDQPGTEQQPEKAKQTISGGGIAAIVIVMAVLITASIIFIALYLNFIYQKKKKTNETDDSNISVHTVDEDGEAKNISKGQNADAVDSAKKSSDQQAKIDSQVIPQQDDFFKIKQDEQQQQLLQDEQKDEKTKGKSESKERKAQKSGKQTKSKKEKLKKHLKSKEKESKSKDKNKKNKRDEKKHEKRKNNRKSHSRDLEQSYSDSSRRSLDADSETDTGSSSSSSSSSFTSSSSSSSSSSSYSSQQLEQPLSPQQIPQSSELSTPNQYITEQTSLTFESKDNSSVDQIYAEGDTEHDKAFNQKKKTNDKKKDKKKKKDKSKDQEKRKKKNSNKGKGQSQVKNLNNSEPDWSLSSTSDSSNDSSYDSEKEDLKKLKKVKREKSTDKNKLKKEEKKHDKKKNKKKKEKVDKPKKKEEIHQEKEKTKEKQNSILDNVKNKDTDTNQSQNDGLEWLKDPQFNGVKEMSLSEMDSTKPGDALNSSDSPPAPNILKSSQKKKDDVDKMQSADDSI